MDTFQAACIIQRMYVVTKKNESFLLLFSVGVVFVIPSSRLGFKEGNPFPYSNSNKFNPFHATYFFRYPPENIIKPLVFLCFRGLSKEISGMKWVKRCMYKNHWNMILIILFLSCVWPSWYITLRNLFCTIKALKHRTY